MKTTNHSEQSSAPARGEIILYQTPDGNASIDVKLENETVWLTQDQLVILFQRDKSVISRHIKNIFQEGELDPKVVVAKFATTTPHGAIIGGIQTHEVVFYNLDVIISVGYRVKSKRGTQFRIWANSVLKEYLIKGYAVKHCRKAEKSVRASFRGTFSARAASPLLVKRCCGAPPVREACGPHSSRNTPSRNPIA